MDKRLRFAVRLLKGEQMALLRREFGVSRIFASEPSGIRSGSGVPSASANAPCSTLAGFASGGCALASSKAMMVVGW